MLVKVVWPINELFSSIDLPCTCKQSRILAVQVSRSTLRTRFTEQFFSTSLFTDSKNSRSRRHENKLAPLNKDNFLTHPPHLSIFFLASPNHSGSCLVQPVCHTLETFEIIIFYCCFLLRITHKIKTKELIKGHRKIFLPADMVDLWSFFVCMVFEQTIKLSGFLF